MVIMVALGMAIIIDLQLKRERSRAQAHNGIIIEEGHVNGIKVLAIKISPVKEIESPQSSNTLACKDSIHSTSPCTPQRDFCRCLQVKGKIELRDPVMSMRKHESW